MNREQLKYMKQRIHDAQIALRPWSKGKRTEPVSVIKAREICVAWDNKCDELDNIRRAKVLTLVRDAEEAMYFSSDEEATKKVKALEALVGKI